MVKLPVWNTLFFRLAVLLWGALIVSHLVAFGVVTQWVLPLLRPELASGQVHLPVDPIVFPSLPPTPGLPHRSGHEVPHAPIGLPMPALLLDYALRFVLIALAAWYGARWLALPVRRLTQAATQLGSTLAKGQTPAPLDEALGTVEVRETARVFNELSRQLQQEFRSRELVLAAVSHDLRTPLTRLRLHLERGSAPPNIESCIGDIREMDSLIGSALELFRQQTTPAPLQRTDIGALVQASVDDLRETDRRHIELEETQASHVAMADPAMLRRVLINVINNAVRHGGNARLHVEAGDEGGVSIIVEDDGPGIAPEQLEQVFDPFFRLAHGGSRVAPGNGLGLYIARDLMQRQNGSIFLSNRAQGGLRTQLWLAGLGDRAGR